MGHHHPDMDLCFDAIHRQLPNSAQPISSFDQNRPFTQNPYPSSSSSSSSSSDHQFNGNFNLNGTLSRKVAGDWKIESVMEGAGVSHHQPLMGIDPIIMMPQQQPDWFKFPIATLHHQNVGLHMNMETTDSQAPELSYEIGDPGLDMGQQESQMELSVPLPVAADGGERKRSFVGDEVMEKTIERRRKRMIKNRESAARSRARKQAYTDQLEHQVRELRKANNWLKKQQEVDTILSSQSTTLPRYQLRRTSSATF